MIDPGAWAQQIILGLVHAGLQHAVVCPGSRSTPLAWAAVRQPGLCCSSLLDERSAAYFALGQARATGLPSLVICTSGTAAANCFPAVVEASASGTPLLVLTADRPAEEQDCSAPQTIDQRKLYGDHVRGCFDLGLPDAEPDACRSVLRKAVQAFALSRWPTAGAVHLNAPIRKPLEPRSVLDLRVAPTLAYPPRLDPAPEAVEHLASVCRLARSGLIVCGPPAGSRPIDPDVLADVLDATGFVAALEASSGLRFRVPDRARAHVFDFLDAALRSPAFADQMQPDCILQLGLPPVSGGFDRYLRTHPDTARHIVAPLLWPDPSGSATSLILADPTATLRALLAALRGHAASRRWQARMQSLGRAVADLAPTPDAFGEARAITCVVDATPGASILVIGNSLPIREVDAYCGVRSDGPRVLVQRGANGIDGVLSGAVGVAVASRQPTTVLLGDVSFLHDVGGLFAARDLDVSLAVVVINNGGGRIFEHLPIARVAGVPGFSKFWTTAHDLDLSRAAALYGLRGLRVTSPGRLSAALREAQARAGATVIEVVLTDADPAAELDRHYAAVDARLQPLAVT